MRLEYFLFSGGGGKLETGLPAILCQNMIAQNIVIHIFLFLSYKSIVSSWDSTILGFHSREKAEIKMETF